MPVSPCVIEFLGDLFLLLLNVYNTHVTLILVPQSRGTLIDYILVFTLIFTEHNSVMIHLHA